MFVDVKRHNMRGREIFAALKTSIGMNLHIMPLIFLIIYEAHTLGMAWQRALYGVGFLPRICLSIKVRNFGDWYEGGILAVTGRVVFIFRIARALHLR